MACPAPSSPAGYTVYLFAQDSTTEYDYFPANNLTSVSAGYWIVVSLSSRCWWNKLIKINHDCAVFLLKLVKRQASCWVAKCSPSDMIVVDMITVKRKDTREANENLLRRFNRRVLQSGVIAKAKASQRFSKPQTRRDRRRVAILRDQRRAEKALQMRLGTFKASR